MVLKKNIFLCFLLLFCGCSKLKSKTLLYRDILEIKKLILQFNFYLNVDKSYSKYEINNFIADNSSYGLNYFLSDLYSDSANTKDKNNFYIEFLKDLRIICKSFVGIGYKKVLVKSLLFSNILMKEYKVYIYLVKKRYKWKIQKFVKY